MKLLKRKKRTLKESTYYPGRLDWQPDYSKWTKEEKIAEYKKCKSDVIYFLSTWGCTIDVNTKGKVPFALYDFQKDVVRDFFNNQNIIVLKSRQLGLTTLLAGIATWLMIFYSDKFVLSVSKTEKTAKTFVNKVKNFYRYTPRFLKPDVIEWNKCSVALFNGSMCDASTTTEDTGVSLSVSLLVMDEAALIKQAEKVWTAVAPTISTGGKAVVLSTPRGAYGWFYDTYVKSEKALQNNFADPDNNFFPIKLMWWVHPLRDEKWYKKMCATFNNNETIIAQELECSFVLSGEGAFSNKKSMNLQAKANSLLKSAIKVEPEILLKNIDEIKMYQKLDDNDKAYVRQILEKEITQNLVFYLEPNHLMGQTVYLGCDVATEGGADHSAINGITNISREQVCCYEGDIEQRYLAYILQLIYLFFNKQAVFAIERNTYGEEVIKTLVRDFNNPRVLDGLDGELGFSTNSATRSIYLRNLFGFITSEPGKLPYIWDVRFYRELETLVTKGNKIVHAAGKHDDLIMATAILVTALLEDNNFSAESLAGAHNSETLEFYATHNDGTKTKEELSEEFKKQKMLNDNPAYKKYIENQQKFGFVFEKNIK